MRSGSVALVGAGPGRADFLTLAGLKAIQQAEVILFDALLAADIRSFFPKKAKAVYVGKRCGQHALKQKEINELLVAYAKSGKRVKYTCAQCGLNAWAKHDVKLMCGSDMAAMEPAS